MGHQKLIKTDCFSLGFSLSLIEFGYFPFQLRKQLSDQLGIVQCLFMCIRSSLGFNANTIGNLSGLFFISWD